MFLISIFVNANLLNGGTTYSEEIKNLTLKKLSNFVQIDFI